MPADYAGGEERLSTVIRPSSKLVKTLKNMENSHEESLSSVICPSNSAISQAVLEELAKRPRHDIDSAARFFAYHRLPFPQNNRDTLVDGVAESSRRAR
jgi:hypothetical protein